MYKNNIFHKKHKKRQEIVKTGERHPFYQVAAHLPTKVRRRCFYYPSWASCCIKGRMGICC